jgi:hypothetical protein
MWTRRCVSSCVALASGVLLAACPEGTTQKLSATCHKAYDKCLMTTGVLGICDNVECAEGKVPPCLACRSQH